MLVPAFSKGNFPLMQALIGFAILAIVIAVGVCLGLVAFAHIGLLLSLAFASLAISGPILAIGGIGLIAVLVIFVLLQKLYYRCTGRPDARQRALLALDPTLSPLSDDDLSNLWRYYMRAGHTHSRLVLQQWCEARGRDFRAATYSRPGNSQREA